VSVVLLCSGLLLTAGPASAHAELVASTPADGDTVQEAPSQLLLRMSESVERTATRVTITDALGHNVSTSPVNFRTKPGAGPGADTEQPTTVVVDLPALGAGQYRVSWTTLSSDDLHVTQGVMVFGVGQQVHSAGAVAEARPSITEASLRWAGLLGLDVVLGSWTLLLLVGPGSPQGRVLALVRRRLMAASAAGAVVAALAGALLPVAQASRAAGPLGPTLRSLLLHESYAVWWRAHEVALLALAVMAWRTYRSARTAAPGKVTLCGVTGLGVLAVVSTVLMGHAGVRASSHLGLVAVESLHVLSALLWTGSVVAAALLLMLRVRSEPGLRALRLTVLRRFGAVAASCLAVAGVTGIILAGARVATVDALVHSVYGRVLLVKVALVAVVLGLGLVNTLVLRPTLFPRWTGPRRDRWLSHRTVSLEAAAILVLVAVTALLSASPPAVGQRWTPVEHASGLLSGQAGDLVETVRVQPNRPGDNFLTVDLFDTRRPSPGRVESVVMSLTSPEDRRTERAATTTGDDSWVVAGQRLSPGRWTAQVRAARPGLADARSTYHWNVPDPRARAVTGWSARPLSTWTGPVAVSLLLAVLLFAASLVGVRRRVVVRVPQQGVAYQLDRTTADREESRSGGRKP
jgi:copper transport protein